MYIVFNHNEVYALSDNVILLMIKTTSRLCNPKLNVPCSIQPNLGTIPEM